MARPTAEQQRLNALLKAQAQVKALVIKAYPDAMKTIVDLMNDETCDHDTRLQAALTVLGKEIE